MTNQRVPLTGGGAKGMIHFIRVDQLVGTRTRITFIRLSLLQKSCIVIPAKAGIQCFQYVLDLGFRRGDGFREFCKSLRLLK